MPAHGGQAGQRRVEESDVLGSGPLLRPVDGRGAAGAQERVVDVARDPDCDAVQPRVQGGGVHRRQAGERGGAPVEFAPVGVQEARPECAEHPGAAVVRGAAAHADEEVARPAVQGREDHLPDAEARRLADAAALRRDHPQSDRLGALHDRRAAGHGEARRRPAAVGVEHRDLDRGQAERVGQGFGEALAAVGHGDFGAFGVGEDSPDSPREGAGRLGGAHRLLEAVGGADDLHVRHRIRAGPGRRAEPRGAAGPGGERERHRNNDAAGNGSGTAHAKPRGARTRADRPPGHPSRASTGEVLPDSPESSNRPAGPPSRAILGRSRRGEPVDRGALS